MAKSKINYNQIIETIDHLANSGTLPEDMKSVAEAVVVLKNYALSDVTKKRLPADRIVTQSDVPTLKDQLQSLIDTERRSIANGQFRTNTPVLAKILEERKFSLAGENLNGLDLNNVDCSGVDFSGSDLSGVNLKRAKVIGTIFDNKTKINGRTNLRDIREPEKAIGLLECLETHTQKYLHKAFLKIENSATDALFKKLRSLKNRTVVVKKQLSEPVVATVSPAQTKEATLATKPLQASNPKKGFGKLRREKAKLKRTAKLKEGDKRVSDIVVSKTYKDNDTTPFDAQQPVTSFSAMQPVNEVNEFDQFLAESVQTAANRRQAQLEQTNTLAANVIGGGIVIDGSGIDELLNLPRSQRRPGELRH